MYYIEMFTKRLGVFVSRSFHSLSSAESIFGTKSIEKRKKFAAFWVGGLGEGGFVSYCGGHFGQIQVKRVCLLSGDGAERRENH